MLFEKMDVHEAQRWVWGFLKGRRIEEQDLIEFMGYAPAIVDRYQELFTVEILNEKFTDPRYVGLIWDMGEQVRQVLKAERRLRKSESLWAKIEKICVDPRYGRGRESFAMLLGRYGGPKRKPTLVALLDDPEICGHAIYALRLLGIKGAERQAEKLLDSPRAWIRTEARKYLEKVN